MLHKPPKTSDRRLRHSDRRILAQRAIIERLREVGADTARAERLLRSFEASAPRGDD